MAGAGIVDKASDALQHGGNGDFESVEIGVCLAGHSSVFLPFRSVCAGAVPQSGKPERKNGLPVGNRVIEILPHALESGGVPLLHLPENGLPQTALIDLPLPFLIQRSQRTFLAPAAAEAGKEIVHVHVDLHVPADILETARLHHRMRLSFQ